MSITSNVNLNIQAIDNVSGLTVFNSVFTGLQNANAIGANADFNGMVSATPYTIAGSFTGFCVKNIDLSNSLIVEWTPTGLSPATVITLPPGGVLMVYNSSQIVAITNLSLSSSGSLTAIQYILFA
jgi:hypothetical protein